MYAQTPYVPPSIYQIAQQYQLGSYIRGSVSSTPKRGSGAIGWIIAGILIGLSSLIGLAAGSGTWTGLSLIIACVCFGLAFAGKREHERESRWDYVLFEGGFVRCSSGTMEAYRWYDIASVQDKITNYKRGSSTMRSVYEATIYLKNGRSIVLGESTAYGGFMPGQPLSLVGAIVQSCKQATQYRSY